MRAATTISPSGKRITAVISGETLLISGKWRLYDEASQRRPERIAYVRIRHTAASVFCLIW